MLQTLGPCAGLRTDAAHWTGLAMYKQHHTHSMDDTDRFQRIKKRPHWQTNCAPSWQQPLKHSAGMMQDQLRTTVQCTSPQCIAVANPTWHIDTGCFLAPQAPPVHLGAGSLTWLLFCGCNHYLPSPATPGLPPAPWAPCDPCCCLHPHHHHQAQTGCPQTAAAAAATRRGYQPAHTNTPDKHVDDSNLNRHSSRMFDISAGSVPLHDA